MRVVLSTIGSRGEAQPMLALAAHLIATGHDARVCAPPDFGELAQDLGIPYVPVGPEVRGTAQRVASGRLSSPDRRAMIEQTIADQFSAVLPAAATGCDVVIGGGGLAIAAHSVAELVGARYVYAAFAPITLPSVHHAPPVFGVLGESRDERPADTSGLWEHDRRRWHLWNAPLNAERARHGLGPVAEVRDHLFTTTPWLAADPTLAPWPGDDRLTVLQTGAWILLDRRPLPEAVEDFLAAGQPPIYVGFGSVAIAADTATAILEGAQALGVRVIVARGWADLAPPDQDERCLLVEDINQRTLFPRCAAVVHHGGAGTTTTAALAGVPQLIAPQMFDQFYFASRVTHLGVGATASPTEQAARSLHRALRTVLDDAMTATARSLAGRIRHDGAAVATEHLGKP